MASVKLAPFVVFLLAAFLMSSMKKIEGGVCAGSCDNVVLPCDADNCFCFVTDPYSLTGYCAEFSSMKKMVEEHPNLCQTHTECTKKGSGNFCARHLNSDIKYGFCFASISEAQNAFFKIGSNPRFTKDFLKMPDTTA